MTDVVVISGFLGAGKTTLIRKLLKEAYAGENCALLENEYGEIGIDGGFLKDTNIQITELNSGCICCTLAGDFDKAIGEIIEKFHPDMLLIEPSGVGKLSDIRSVVDAQAEATGKLRLRGCATVVDASKCKMYMKNFGEFFLDQVKHADAIVLSRTQNITVKQFNETARLLRAQNEQARMVVSFWDEISGKIIDNAIAGPKSLIEQDDEREHHHHEHEHHHHEHEHEHHEHEHEHHHDHEHEHHHDHEHEHHHEHEHEHEHEHHHDHEHHHEHHHHGHDADEIFDNISVETVNRVDKQRLEEALESLNDESRFGTVLRMKGILQATDGGWIHFDYVPGDFEVRPGGADYSGRLCAIGVNLNRAEILAHMGV